MQGAIKTAIFVSNHLEVGNLETPLGTKYKGFKLSFKW